MSGRIVLHLDRGLGWTKPQVVACCGLCGTELARHAVRVTEVALVAGGHVVAYPEGRIGLTADGWPERGRTGMARLALGLGVPVIPVSQWGAHEVLQYGNDWGKAKTLLRAIVRTDGVRALFESMRGEPFIREAIVHRPYDDWAFEVLDPNGYIVVFGGAE